MFYFLKFNKICSIQDNFVFSPNCFEQSASNTLMHSGRFLGKQSGHYYLHYFSLFFSCFLNFLLNGHGLGSCKSVCPLMSTRAFQIERRVNRAGATKIKTAVRHKQEMLTPTSSITRFDSSNSSNLIKAFMTFANTSNFKQRGLQVFFWPSARQQTFG